MSQGSPRRPNTKIRTLSFCCIPGSHRANFPVPDACRRLEDNELLRHVHLNAGDALVFSEALVHGTYAVPGSSQRRAVFARYMNNHSYFRRPPEHEALTALPATPNHTGTASRPFNASLLTERQRRLVAEPAYARGHAPVGGVS
ncbi:phytanoyl-CoA dioxygenase family protein [Stenotrophomonas oahuensis]|uniref:phytanoyl-CoA dioxygenase family protein n=1 Tax=Stenotrophomonas oahuensis TaxID=3003271 RepID=UPI003CCCDCAD